MNGKFLYVVSQQLQQPQLEAVQVYWFNSSSEN